MLILRSARSHRTLASSAPASPPLPPPSPLPLPPSAAAAARASSSRACSFSSSAIVMLLASAPRARLELPGRSRPPVPGGRAQQQRSAARRGAPLPPALRRPRAGGAGAARVKPAEFQGTAASDLPPPGARGGWSALFHASRGQQANSLDVYGTRGLVQCSHWSSLSYWPNGGTSRPHGSQNNGACHSCRSAFLLAPHLPGHCLDLYLPPQTSCVPREAFSRALPR